MDRIDALRVFINVAELGSFSAAAEECQVKQSTASKWIAELESEFGATMIQRTTRSLRLTEAGQRFLHQARGVLAAYEGMKLDFEERSSELTGSLRLTVPVVFGRLCLLSELSAFLTQHLKVGAEIVLSDRYVNLIDEGFDLAVRIGAPQDSTVVGRKLRDGRRVLVAAPGYLQCGVSLDTPSELREHECLLHGGEAAKESWKFRRAGEPWKRVKVGGRVRSNNSWMTLELARAGLGIALLADWLVQDDLATGALVELLPQFESSPAPIYLLSPPGRFPSRAVRALSDHLAAALTPQAGTSSAAAAPPST